MQAVDSGDHVGAAFLDLRKLNHMHISFYSFSNNWGLLVWSIDGSPITLVIVCSMLKGEINTLIGVWCWGNSSG